MLIKIDKIEPDPMMALIAKMIAEGNKNSDECKELKSGFYLNGHWSFDNVLGRGKVKECYPEIEGLENCYGVCDTPEQFIERFEKILDEDPRKFVVSFCIVRKENQTPSGGWRWHKWGPYIGDKEPQCEYLYDEPEIERACCYHVYELN